MVSFKKIIKSWAIVSLASNSLAAAELVNESAWNFTKGDGNHTKGGGGSGGNDGLLCHIPPSVENFDLAAFVDRTWYVQDATKTAFISETDTCVTAQYNLLDTPTAQGWTISVLNSAKNIKGKETPDLELCALPHAKAAGAGTFQVAQCSLPPTVIKPNYFVLAFSNVAPAYALVVSGVQAAISDPNCGCVAPSGGLFIFTSDQVRNEAVITTVRNIAKDLGYGLCDLFEIDQTGC